jgi:hypothetical protein
VNGWALGIIVCICAPIISLALWCVLVPKYRNPVIMDKPQPDRRVWSVGRDVKRWKA